jgi:hypothetical protein
MERITEYQDERWKERARQIRELDGNQCAICGAKGLLHVHHLSYPPAPFHLWDSLDNELVSLCPECHRKVHESTQRITLDAERNVVGFLDEKAQAKYDYDMFMRRCMELCHNNEPNCAKCIHLMEDSMRLVCMLNNQQTEPQHYPCWDFEPEEYAKKILRDCNSCEHYTAKDESHGWCGSLDCEIRRWNAKTDDCGFKNVQRCGLCKHYDPFDKESGHCKLLTWQQEPMMVYADVNEECEQFERQ